MIPTCDIFVSYSQPDKDCALAIVASLEARGIGVWVAPRDISPSADWAAEIVDAIGRARLMVLVFSAHCNASPQVRREVERAVHRQLPVLPFRIEDVLPSKSLEYFLSAQHWLDAFPGPREPYYRRLADHCESLFNHAPPLPAKTTQLRHETSELVLGTQRQMLEKSLALHVGPIATVLVKRAVSSASTWQELVDRLAGEIEPIREREQFTAACQAFKP